MEYRYHGFRGSKGGSRRFTNQHSVQREISSHRRTVKARQQEAEKIEAELMRGERRPAGRLQMPRGRKQWQQRTQGALKRRRTYEHRAARQTGFRKRGLGSEALSHASERAPISD
jgi:hypothetical protein